MAGDAGFLVEDSSEGRTLVLTSGWTAAAGAVLARGDVDGLTVNYARGFSGSSLEFLEAWGLRRLDVLDRGIGDLSPIARLGGSLEELSVQAAPRAGLDLRVLPRLRSVAGEWGLLRDTLGAVDALESVTTWRFDEVDLHAFRDHIGLQQLTIKEAPYLESLSGLANLDDLDKLVVKLARGLQDTGDAAGLVALREFELEDCPAINGLDDVEALVNLRFLGFSDCGEIASLAPLGALQALEELYAWGSTRIMDDDLTPVTRLPRLRDLRMRDRRSYKPRLADLVLPPVGT
jgi:hypothetical protein